LSGTFSVPSMFIVIFSAMGRSLHPVIDPENK
jgi:hypothetical protein